MKKIRDKNITKFLNSWDKEIYNLNIKLKQMNQRQKRENVILRKKEGYTFRINK